MSVQPDPDRVADAGAPRDLYPKDRNSQGQPLEHTRPKCRSAVPAKRPAPRSA